MLSEIPHSVWLSSIKYKTCPVFMCRFLRASLSTQQTEAIGLWLSQKAYGLSACEVSCSRSLFHLSHRYQACPMKSCRLKTPSWLLNYIVLHCLCWSLSQTSCVQLHPLLFRERSTMYPLSNFRSSGLGHKESYGEASSCPANVMTSVYRAGNYGLG